MDAICWEDELDRIPGLAGFDALAGLNYQGGNAEAYLRVLRCFVRGLSERMEALRVAQQQDINDYMTGVHAMKSSARFVGAYEIAQAAEKLENEGRAGNFRVLEKETPKLLLQCEVFREIMTPYLQSVFPETEKIQVTIDEMRVQFKRIADCAQAYDLDEAETAMAELDKFDFTKTDLQVLYGQVKDAVEQIDYDVFGRLAQTCCMLCDSMEHAPRQ